MQSKIKNFSTLLLITIWIFSCKKNNSTPNSPTPPLYDTLGAGWQRIKVDTSINFQDIYFPTTQIGFLAGANYLGRSTDGGLSWQQAILPDTLKQNFVNLFFIDANTGWVTGDKFLLRTKDGGNSWQKVFSAPLFDVQFLDANNGFATSVMGLAGIYKTTDGGQTFQRIFSSASAQGLFFLNKDFGFVSMGGYYLTRDGGLTFSTINNMRDTYAIQFLDSLHGWMAGPGAFKTTDGGKSITQIIAPSNYGDLQFFDLNNGYIMSGSAIYSTNDGGNTLTQLCAIHKTQLIEFHFTDLNHGWATGLGGFVYRYLKP
jgi:photosystem II stability/assembly factor-like uncharacterized protein